jgi:hypothetical protein
VSDPIDDVKGEVSEALAARRGEPSKDAEEALRQVGELRAAMTRDIAVLRSRLPEPSEVKGQAGAAGGVAAGGLAAAGLIVLLLRRRGKKRADEERVRTEAMALARELSRLELDPEEVVEGRRGSATVRIGMALAALAGLVGAVLTFRKRLQGDDEDWQT